MSASVIPSPTSHSRPSRWLSSAASTRLPPECHSSSRSRACSGRPEYASQNRATAMFGSRSYCSKNIHCSTCARRYGSSGTKRVPSPKYQRIAPDSPSAPPSSRTSVGTRNDGLSPPSTSGRRAVDDVHRPPLVWDPEVGEEQPNLVAVARDRAVVEQHRSSLDQPPPHPRYCSRDGRRGRTCRAWQLGEVGHADRPADAGRRPVPDDARQLGDERLDRDG